MTNITCEKAASKTALYAAEAVFYGESIPLTIQKDPGGSVPVLRRRRPGKRSARVLPLEKKAQMC